MLTLNANAMHRFYESLGYKASGDIFLEENIEHILINKTIWTK